MFTESNAAHHYTLIHLVVQAVAHVGPLNINSRAGPFVGFKTTITS